MANEISLKIELSSSKGGRFSVFRLFDQTGTKFTHARQTIGTSEEAIVFNDVAVGNAWFAAQNKDTGSNIISIRLVSGNANQYSLIPGACHVTKIGANPPSVFAIATPSSAVLEYLVLEP